MKILRQAITFFFLLTILVGGVYPVMVYGISRVLFPGKASGGIIVYNDKNVGAELIAQEFTGENFFWGRPSAAGFNATASSGSNYALTNNDHQKAVFERKAKGLDFDLLTTSGSGLDPHISPKAALMQVERVARVRNLNQETVIQLVNENIEGRQLGFLGEERVNVLRLNLNLERLAHE
ncbi:MAG: potassium-transporting ATPase subunit KdpC [Bdellovibrionales bacterium]|nr:potassium-transporting ATPase subunit KdpC [Bdellovibrionales bacterium]